VGIGKSLIFSGEIRYLRKWIPIAVLIGVVSGVGAIVFDQAIIFVSKLLLGGVVGYYPPTPFGEGSIMPTAILSPYLLPIVTMLGGLLSGILVFGLAPEAEGHGTDAAIEAFHRKKGDIRSRIPIVKMVASAITIGSGGSAGREGPTAQIGAGFGSFIGKRLHLSLHDRRIALAVGIGAGIGAIFKCPFGGAILAAEILYTADFEVDALFPGFIASTVGYSIFGLVNGWTPIFGTTNFGFFQDPLNLPFFALLGLACGLVGIAYVLCFYGTRDLFKRFNIPNYIKPAIGGLAVGLIGLFFPQVLGVGYGWLQIVMDGNFAVLPLVMLPVIIGLKIVATSLTIGSGGSGGVFGPALVIGGMLGALLWGVLSWLLPNSNLNVAVFVIVGMMAFFGGIGKVPVAVILMASEMTGSYTLLVPSMIAVAIAYVITTRHTIYRSQVGSRSESPAHREEFTIPLLEQIYVQDAMNKTVTTLYPEQLVSEAAEVMKKKKIHGIPIINHQDELIGILAIRDILELAIDLRSKTTVGSIMTKDLIVTYPDESLSDVMEKITGEEVGRLPVVERLNQKRLLGIITRQDIWRVYRTGLHAILESEKNS
jgi:CIC family chloride channel protein